MKKRFIVPLILSFSLISCETNKAELITHVVDGEFINDEYVFPMNTVTQLRMYYQDQFDEVVGGFDEIVRSLSKEVDRYHSYEGINNLKTINDSCGSGQEIVVSNSLFDLIKEAIDLTLLTEGRFNLAIELKNTLGIDKAIELSGFTRKELENETLTRTKL